MTVKLFLAAGALLASTSAWAQSSPAAEQTADDLVCQLSGDCEGVADIAATQDKPESRGFVIKRRTAANDASEPAKRVTNATRPRARVTADALRSRATASSPGRNRNIARPAAGRADLRVSFVTGSAEITGAGRREADKFITALSAPSLAGKKFRIEGHTDSVGSRDFNLDLSKRRAESVVDYLVAHGADRSRFTVVGYGFDRPLAGTSASDGVNRRVEVELVK